MGRGPGHVCMAHATEGQRVNFTNPQPYDAVTVDIFCILRQTDRAYLLEAVSGTEFWVPKACCNISPRERRAEMAFKYAEEAGVNFRLTGRPFVQGDGVLDPPVKQRKRKRLVE